VKGKRFYKSAEFFLYLRVYARYQSFSRIWRNWLYIFYRH
jgi:hypothetical protein